jgi:hypothetical protein
MNSEKVLDSLFNKFNEEKKTGELLQLPSDFYKTAESELSGETGTSSAAEAQNHKSTLSALKQKRRQKILIYLAYGKPLPDPIPEEERRTYERILSFLNGGEKQQKPVHIRIVIKIPEVITTTGSTIGPYQEGETVAITNPSDAEFIINNKIGERIEE